MNLILDIGNTSAKIALYNSRELVSKKIVSHVNLLQEVDELLKEPAITRCIVSSVSKPIPGLIDLITEKTTLLAFNHLAAIPITNCYKSPETLGLDRLANAIALSHLFPNSNALSIDIGTCIKFDFKTNNNQYLGGSISPGLAMRLNAMHDYTEKLPLLKAQENAHLVGTTTEESMHSGVMCGIKAEIDGIIAAYSEQYSELKVVLTGGDHNYFAKAFKNSIFARPNLTLEGLNEVLLFNE